MARASELYQKISEQITTRPVSESLTDLILFAQLIGDSELERWGKLESDGYVVENPAKRQEDAIPDYRVIAGQYRDHWGRPLVIQDPKLSFVSRDWLNSSVVELEDLAQKAGPLSYSNPRALQLLKQNLGVEVGEFIFSPTALKGILNAIRNRILEHLSRHAGMAESLEAQSPMPEAQRTIFVSKSFAQEDEEVNGYFEDILRSLQVSFETAKKYEGIAIFEKVEGKLNRCDFVIGIYVKRYEDEDKHKVLTAQWLIRETGYAKGQGKDFIALAEEGIGDIAGFDAEKELIFFNRESRQKMLQATLKFLQALVYHGFVRGMS